MANRLIQKPRLRYIQSRPAPLVNSRLRSSPLSILAHTSNYHSNLNENLLERSTKTQLVNMPVAKRPTVSQARIARSQSAGLDSKATGKANETTCNSQMPRSIQRAQSAQVAKQTGRSTRPRRAASADEQLPESAMRAAADAEKAYVYRRRGGAHIATTYASRPGLDWSNEQVTEYNANQTTESECKMEQAPVKRKIASAHELREAGSMKKSLDTMEFIIRGLERDQPIDIWIAR